jgi:hypothetical protein
MLKIKHGNRARPSVPQRFLPAAEYARFHRPLCQIRTAYRRSSINSPSARGCTAKPRKGLSRGRQSNCYGFPLPALCGFGEIRLNNFADFDENHNTGCLTNFLGVLYWDTEKIYRKIRTVMFVERSYT